MGYERDTYYFDRRGQMTSNKSDDSVLVVHSVEHDVYGNPSFDASVFDVEGAKEALPILLQERPHTSPVTTSR
mgnify:CR=1 FL=1